jgi:hypothetical protein
MGGDEFVAEGAVRGLREQTLLVQERQNAPLLFDKVNSWLQVQAKVDILPFEDLALVFFLLQHKHGVVEKLLELFVCVIDAELFE